MLLLIAVVLISALQSPPAPQHGKKSHKIHQAEKSKPPEPTPTPTPPPPVAKDADVSAQPSKENPTQEKNDAKCEARNWVDWINAFSTAVIALFTVVMAAAIIFQLRATHRQERAWIAIESIDVPEELSHYTLMFPMNIDLGYVFKNFGNTPAKLTDSRLIFRLVTSIDDLPSQPNYGPKQEYPRFPLDGGLMVPNITFELRQAFQGPDGTPALSNEDLTAIRSGAKALVSYGFIEYRDAFDKRHETRFCHIYRVLKGTNYYGGDFGIAGPSEYNKHT